MTKLVYTDTATGTRGKEVLDIEFSGEAICTHWADEDEMGEYKVVSWILTDDNSSAAFIVRSLGTDGYFGDYLIAGIAYNL